MNYTHEYEGSPTIPVCQAALALATVAAPFAAKGMSHEQAAKQALDLIFACKNHLAKLQMNDLQTQVAELMTLDLEEARQRFKYSARPSLKKLVYKAFEPSVADKLWGQAIDGQKVFTREILKQMTDAKVLAEKERGVLATAARTAKQLEKASSKK